MSVLIKSAIALAQLAVSELIKRVNATALALPAPSEQITSINAITLALLAGSMLIELVLKR